MALSRPATGITHQCTGLVASLSLEVQQGKYHLVEQCQRDRLAAIHEVKQGLLDLADSFPGSPEDKAILRGRVLELLRRFSAIGGGIDAV